MIEEAGGPAPSPAELDELLLAAKLTAPPTRPGSVSRAALIERARGSDCRTIGLTAPAGYGKSTFLAEWAAAEDRRVAWVTLDRFDDDPAVLLRLLATAYTTIAPESGGLVADTSGLGVAVLGRAAPHLASALRASSVPFVLILDDLHEVQSPACHDVLGVVISGIPAGSQLVTASRAEQPHLPRLRAAGDAVEYGIGDLALDASAAAQIFAETDVVLTAELAAAVTARTEGWPAGLYLAALIAKDSDGEVLAVAGDDRYVADYLYRESLLQVPDDTQRFLRRTAVLEQFSGPLCDAVLEGSGSSEQLRRLEAANLFLVPLDRRRSWYRYHSLFREFLLAELRRTEPDVVMKLHLRVADWYEANGAPVLALEHLLNTNERDRCVQLLTTLMLPAHQAGNISTVQRWLAAIGDDAIDDYPPLGVLAGWVAAYTGETVDAQRWAARAEAATFDRVSTDGTASFASARAMLRAMMCGNGPEQMLADARFAIAQEPAWSGWRATALCLNGEAELLAGNVDSAVAFFAEAMTVASSNTNSHSLTLSASELAVVAMDRGRWADAAEHLDRAIAAISEHRLHDYATSQLAFAAAARLALHRGDRTTAESELIRGMRGRVTLTFVLPNIAVRVRLQLAKVCWAIADHTTARHLVREIDDILRARPDLGTLVDEVEAFRRIVTASTQAGATGASPLSPAELRLLPYLQTHLTFREIGERLFVSRNTVSSQVGSIYRKLGVSSRNDAVQQATAIGLLGG